MNFYTLESIFNFGKHKGQTLQDVFNLQPSYINWCSINVDNFVISTEVMEELKDIVPYFSFSTEAIEILASKRAKWDSEQIPSYNYASYERDDTNYEEDNFDALTDGQCGSYSNWRGNWDGLRDAMGY
jgi:hypothetical protein